MQYSQFSRVHTDNSCVHVVLQRSLYTPNTQQLTHFLEQQNITQQIRRTTISRTSSATPPAATPAMNSGDPTAAFAGFPAEPVLETTTLPDGVGLGAWLELAMNTVRYAAMLGRLLAPAPLL